MSAKFEIFKGQDADYYFRLKAANGENIGFSEGYTVKQSANTGIQSVKINSLVDARYEIFRGIDSNYYFRLKASNGEIILQSQRYKSLQGAQTGANSVKANASTAPVIDLTASTNSLSY